MAQQIFEMSKRTNNAVKSAGKYKIQIEKLDKIHNWEKVAQLY